MLFITNNYLTKLIFIYLFVVRKYKIEKAKVNKHLVGDEVTVSKVKPKGGKGGGRKPPRVTLNDVLKEMREGFTAIRNDIDHIVEVNNLVR